MSIDTDNISKAATTGQAQQVSQMDASRWRRILFSPLWLCLLLALAIRIWVIIRTQGFVEGDEVLTGIQAQHILQGNFPIYFYGQPYMGSLEAYLIALCFALFGSSVWTLRIEPAVLSLILVGITWKFATVLADGAPLPPKTKRFFATIAAFIAALPPLYDVIAELHTWGGYIETFIIILLLLTSTLRLTQRWQASCSYKELAWRWVGIGFLVGLGFWVYPLIISAVVAAAVWILGYIVILLYSNYKSQPSLGSLLRPVKQILLTIFALPAALVGFAPALIWGAQNNWANISYIVNLGGGVPQRLDSIIHVAEAYTTCVGPRIVSGALPAEPSSIAELHFPILLLGIVCIFGSAILLLASFAFNKPSPLLVQARNLSALPLLFGTWTALSFATGKSSVFALISCNYDPVGRYATPLALVLPFFYATVFTFLLQFVLQSRNSKTTAKQTSGDLQSRSHSSSRLVSGLLFTVLLASLALQTLAYQQTNIARAFESPYCHQAPINDDALVKYLESQHIHYAWSTNWIAYRVVFETDSQIIVADAMPYIPPVVNFVRIPANAMAVRHAERPSFIVFVWKSDSYPPLLHALDAAGVKYKAARISADSDTDILVVTPLNRTVSPFESKAISSNFASCSY